MNTRLPCLVQGLMEPKSQSYGTLTPSLVIQEVPCPMDPLSKRVRLQVERLLYMFTAPARVLPDFIVIGAHKAGTTSFYEYLRQHPMIISAWKKDIKYFDLHFHRGSLWYRSYFPSKYRMRVDRYSGQRYITGDGATDYFFSPQAPQRIANLLPDVKLLLALRSPVDRAYSHYQHIYRNGWEPLSFEEAIEQENHRLQADAEDDETMPAFRRYGYVKKGLYANYLEKWFEIFPKDRIFIVRSEDFFGDDALDVYCQAQEFLGLPIWKHIKFKNANPGKYQDMKPKISQKLAEYYKPHNQRLYELVGRDFGW